MGKIDKEIYSKIMPLYVRQTWLPEREERLMELLNSCKTINQKLFLINMLNEFNFLSEDSQRRMLVEIAGYIAEDSGFDVATTQIVATTIDDEADSGQLILQQLKVPLYDVNWDSVQTTNNFGRAIHYINKGAFQQLIVVDEFVGSGKTILKRIAMIKNDAKNPFQMKFCFLAGMDYAIKKIEDAGYDVFCPLRYDRGISDKFVEEQLVDAALNMRELEESLMRYVKDFDLLDFTFGYNRAEALYATNGNAPNSVFPIFWWPRDKNNKPRKTLLQRFQKGLR